MPADFLLNQNVINMEYAVRGPLYHKASELRKQGRTIIPCNIGNPQALGQTPVSFYRQVLSLLEYPPHINRERTLKGKIRPDMDSQEWIPDYILDFSADFLEKIETGMGAYTDSKGAPFIREAVSRFIDKRDGVTPGNGVPSIPDHIFLTNGASEGIKCIIELLISDENDGVMIPIPTYPLYSATIARLGGRQVNYYPDEESGWTLNRDILEESLAKAQRDNVNVKAIVVINPANPTGAILDKKSIIDIIEFSGENGLAIFADEVYQDNLYGSEFLSFSKALGDDKNIPLFSFHSASKGFYGECGHRGGYFEVRNPPASQGSNTGFIDILFKQASVNLCSNTTGQALIYLLSSPPPEGSEPYDQFNREKQGILADLYEKAGMIKNSFKEMDDVECFGKVGAMYLFPRFNTLPAGKTDFDYCVSLLEETGLTTVNGSGFGQKEGTHHLRIAFLPPKNTLEDVLPRWIEFHNNYVRS